MAYQIYTYPNNPRAWKAIIAGKYAGVEINEVPDFKMGETNKTDDFLKNVNPYGKVPALVGPDGSVWESNAIARYVARINSDANLYGSSNYEAGQVDQWIDWAREFELPGAVWIYPIMGFIPNDKAATNRAKTDIRNLLDFLNAHLSLRTFIVGERLTLADIIVSMTLYWFYQKVLDNGFRKKFQNVNRWFLTCINQPNFKSVLGDFKMCDKMAVAKESENNGESSGSNNNNNNNNNNNVKKEKKKEQKKKEQPKPAAKAKKGKNPLDLLPKSSFNLEEFKRVYSNEKDTRNACKWLWEHFDEEGFCIFFSEYKYPEDNEVDFMTRNLVGGMLQRLDSLRKYGMGSVLLLGAMPEIHVEGVWILRGNDIPFELSDCVDYPSYEFTRADHKDPVTKQKIDDFLCWEGKFDREFIDGKVFK